MSIDWGKSGHTIKFFLSEDKFLSRTAGNPVDAALLAWHHEQEERRHFEIMEQLRQINQSLNALYELEQGKY